MRKALFVLALILGFCSPLYAAEIKIVDSTGLIRAFGHFPNKGAVSISLQSKNNQFPNTIQLTNLDGLSSPKIIKHSGSGQYQVNDINPGSWEIELPNAELTIKAVEFIQ